MADVPADGAPQSGSPKERFNLDLITDAEQGVATPLTIEELKAKYSSGVLTVPIEATHFGYINSNAYNYHASGGRRSHGSWTRPFEKPFLRNHDRHGPVYGRVKSALYKSTSDKTGYHLLTTAVSDPEQIARILDGRTLTVSVGSSSVGSVFCSVCKHDITQGAHPVRYEIDKAPSAEWLAQAAGPWGECNEQLWGYQATKMGDGKTVHSCMCSHERHSRAPMGGNQFASTYWDVMLQMYNEVSDVAMPADVNLKTGEYAHIHTPLAKLSVIAHDSEILRPSSMVELTDALSSGMGLVDTATFLALVSTSDNEDEALVKYLAAGGRLASLAPPVKTLDEAIRDRDVRAFGDALRRSDLTREEKAALDRTFAQQLLRRGNIPSA